MDQPTEIEKPEEAEEETTTIHVTVTDGGDFGFDSCGRCGKEVIDWPSRCPHCGIKLKGMYVTPSFGGSDF